MFQGAAEGFPVVFEEFQGSIKLKLMHRKWPCHFKKECGVDDQPKRYSTTTTT